MTSTRSSWLAGSRAGVCTRRQLLEHGVRPAAISRRVTAGLLRPTQRGVYIIDELTGPRTPLHHAIARVPAGELTRSTAGRLQDYPLDPSADQSIVDVATAHGYSRRLDGVALHRRRRPTPADDLIIIDGLPVTGPAMTIIDLAAVVGPARLRHLVHTQINVGVPTLAELVACFDAVARRGLNGIAALRKVLDPMTDGAPVSESALEQAMTALLVEHGITGFDGQYQPPWYDGRRGIVDFAHPELRIVVETDGRRWHRRDQDMAEDRRRDRAAARHGWVAIRVTWHEVTERQAATAAEIRAIMTRRLHESRPAV